MNKFSNLAEIQIQLIIWKNATGGEQNSRHFTVKKSQSTISKDPLLDQEKTFSSKITVTET